MGYEQMRAECQGILDRLVDGADICRNGKSLRLDWIAELRAEIAIYDDLLATHA